MKILILASNPRKDLNLDQEIRDLKDVIERSNKGQQFEVEDALAVRVGDLQDLLLRHKPQIVHFCGHGGGKPGLVFEGKNGGEQWVQTEALRDLFKLLSNWVGCVLLNACYSEEQANEIVKHVDYVIGMNQEIRDDAAIAFSKGFYRALGYDLTIEQAYEFGCNAIQLEITGSSIVRSAAVDLTRKAEVVNAVNTVIIPEHLKPTLKTKQGTLNFEQWKINAETPLAQKDKQAIQWELAQEITGTSPVKSTPIEDPSTSAHRLASPNSHNASTSINQRTRMLTGFLLTCLLIAGGAGGYYGYHYWQNYRQWQQEQPAQEKLKQAQEFANQGDFEKAIALLNQIPPNSAAVSQVQPYLNDWSRELLKKAEGIYQKSDIDKAVKLAQMIPETSSIYQDAQAAIEEWNKDKKAYEKIKKALGVWDTSSPRRILPQIKSQGLYKLAEAEIAEVEANQLKRAIELRDEGNIDGAIELARKISKSSSSYQQVQETIGTWEASQKQQQSNPPAAISSNAPQIPSSLDDAPLQQAEVEPLFREFISDWNNKRYVEQLELLAKEEFTSTSYKRETKEQYAAHKYAEYANVRRDLAKYEWIRVEVSNEQFISLSEDKMLVKYMQYYSNSGDKSNRGYESRGTNELYFRRRNGRIEIYEERFYRDWKKP